MPNQGQDKPKMPQETRNDDSVVHEHKEQKLGRRDQAEGEPETVEDTPGAEHADAEDSRDEASNDR